MALASTGTIPETQTASPPLDGRTDGLMPNPAVFGPTVPAGNAPPGKAGTGDVGIIMLCAAAPAANARTEEIMAATLSRDVDGKAEERNTVARGRNAEKKQYNSPSSARDDITSYQQPPEIDLEEALQSSVRDFGLTMTIVIFRHISSIG